jgi:hypothetical protein
MLMALIARIGVAWIRWMSSHGLTERDDSSADAKKDGALQLGVRGERYAYWYLRRLGYIFVAYDGETLAIVEVRTRLATPRLPGLPEMSIGKEKHEVLVRTAEYFLRERHVRPCPVRFDVVAIDEIPGHPPAVRLHKVALPPSAA